MFHPHLHPTLPRMLLPGGAFTFRMRNVTLAGGPVSGVSPLAAPHHCGMIHPDGPHDVPGSLCSVTLLLEGIDFSRVDQGSRDQGSLVQFGVNGGNPLAPAYLAEDSSLGGFTSIVSPHLNGFGWVVAPRTPRLVPGCSGPHQEWGGGWGCRGVRVRRLTVWAPDLGDLRLVGPGYLVDPDYRWVRGA